MVGSEPQRGVPHGETEKTTAYIDCQIDKQTLFDIEDAFRSFDEKEGSVTDELFRMHRFYKVLMPVLESNDTSKFWSDAQGDQASDFDEDTTLRGAVMPNEVVLTAEYGDKKFVDTLNNARSTKYIVGRFLLRAHDISVSQENQTVSLSVTCERMKFDRLPQTSMDILDDSSQILPEKATWYIRLPLPKKQQTSVVSDTWDE